LASQSLWSGSTPAIYVCLYPWCLFRQHVCLFPCCLDTMKSCGSPFSKGCFHVLSAVAGRDTASRRRANELTIKTWFDLRADPLFTVLQMGRSSEKDSMLSPAPPSESRAAIVPIRILDLELMSTLAFHPARGPTPFLRANVTPISRGSQDGSCPCEHVGPLVLVFTRKQSRHVSNWPSCSPFVSRSAS
jgi:hypothetical protein